MITRRSLLRGLGFASGALPVFRRGIGHAQTATAAPRRFVFLFSAEGTYRRSFFPNVTDTDVPLTSLPALPPTLQPLADLRSKMLLIRGINTRSGDHREAVAQLLTGAKCQSGVPNYAMDVSLDQAIAAQVGRSTRFPSLQFGVQVNDGQGWGRLCYSGPAQPLPPMEDPYAAFDRVFAGGVPSADPAAQTAARKLAARRKSVLDYVAGNLTSLRTSLGADDRPRLDAHLDAIRAAENSLDKAGASASCTGAPMLGAKIDPKAPANYPMVAKLHMDVLAAALICDLTRVATVQWEKGSSPIVYGWLGATGVHHDYAHSLERMTDKMDIMAKITTFHLEQLAYLAKKLQAVPDRDGRSVLDNSLVVHGSDFATGMHMHLDAPFLILGSGGGYFRTGRYVEVGRCEGTYHEDKVVKPGRSHNDLLVSLGNAMGLPIRTFGDPAYCAGPVPGLT
jgi:hypothetical protein